MKVILQLISEKAAQKPAPQPRPPKRGVLLTGVWAESRSDLLGYHVTVSPADVPVRRFNSIRSALRHLDADCDGNVDRSEATALFFGFLDPIEAKSCTMGFWDLMSSVLSELSSRLKPWIRKCFETWQTMQF